MKRINLVWLTAVVGNCVPVFDTTVVFASARFELNISFRFLSVVNGMKDYIDCCAGLQGAMESSMDFLKLLDTDTSIMIFKLLDVPADLVHVSAVSHAWKDFGEKSRVNIFMYLDLQWI